MFHLQTKLGYLFPDFPYENRALRDYCLKHLQLGNHMLGKF